MPMRAFLPTGDDALVALADRDVPVPADDEALVAVEAYSVNRGEILLLAAGRQGPPGKDIAGSVIQTAADGSGPAAGTRVVAHLEGGGWAQQACVPTGRLGVLPDAVSAVTAAALPLAGLTALRLLRECGDLAGRRMLVTGASGGVGHYLVELGAQAGTAITAVTSSPARGERLPALGADVVVQRVEDAEGPFDVVMDAVGGETFGRALLKLGGGGLMLWYGQAGQQAAQADFFAVAEGPGLVTIRSFLYWAGDASDGRDLSTLVALVAAGRLNPEIGLTADWSQTPAVLAAVRDRQVRGNAVLTIGAGG